jgi:hypothetical protein
MKYFIKSFGIASGTTLGIMIFSNIGWHFNNYVNKITSNDIDLPKIIKYIEETSN